MGEAQDAQSVKLVDVATRKVVRKIDVGDFPLDPAGFGVVADVRFADDGRTVLVSVTAERADRGFRRTCDGMTRAPAGPWDAAFASAGGPRALRRRFPLDVTACSSPGGDHVRGRRGNAARAAADPGGRVRHAGLSPDGRSAALGGFDGSVAILDLRTGERRTLAGRHEDRVRALAFSADGRTLATTAGDGRVLVWDLRSGEVRETLTGHTGAINNLEVQRRRPHALHRRARRPDHRLGHRR